MNEKFSDLYHLAWGYAEDDDEYKEDPTYSRRCVVQSRIFAELIVEECANICTGYSRTVLTYSQFGSNAADDCARIIKEHFGATDEL